MRREANTSQFFTAESVSKLPLRERVGLSIEASDASDALLRIHEAEDAGVRQVWMILSSGLDELLITLVPVSDEKTERKRLLGLIGNL